MPLGKPYAKISWHAFLFSLSCSYLVTKYMFRGNRTVRCVTIEVVMVANYDLVHMRLDTLSARVCQKSVPKVNCVYGIKSEANFCV